MGRPKHEDKRRFPVQVMHNAEEWNLVHALMTHIQNETGFPLSIATVYRSLMLKEARARGLVDAPARDVPVDSTPTPAPRTRTGRTEPPPASHEAPSGHRRIAPTKKGGG